MDKARLSKRKKALKDFGERLRICRLAAGYATQLEFVESFSNELGLELGAYKRYERGEASPDFYLLPEIAKKLGKSLDFLLTGRRDTEPKPGG